LSCFTTPKTARRIAGFVEWREQLVHAQKADIPGDLDDEHRQPLIETVAPQR
jgi:hypothetical protein